jgi:hypothetical protein
MAREIATSSYLYCSDKLKSDKRLFDAARKIIYSDSGFMPRPIYNQTEVGNLPSGTVFYYPIMMDNKHWWLDLIGTDVQLIDKLIVSPECQLAVIMNNCDLENVNLNKKKRLSVGEVHLGSSFFKVVSRKIACVHDIVATSRGTAMILFQGLNEDKLTAALRDTGNKYYGGLGAY